MKKSILKDKSILAIGSKIDLLQALKGKIQGTCPECRLDMATTPSSGRQLMLMITYNLIILDMVNTLWSNLIDLAANRKFPVLALSDNGPIEEASNRPSGAIIRAAVPRESLNQIVPTVEEVLKREKMSSLRRALDKPWRFMMKFGPGYQYPQKRSGQGFQDGEAIYIYY